MGVVVAALGFIPEETLPPGEPCQEVVERLEELLAQAKAGQFQRIAYAAVGHRPANISWVGAGYWDASFAAVCDLQHSIACARRQERLELNDDVV